MYIYYILYTCIIMHTHSNHCHVITQMNGQASSHGSIMFYTASMTWRGCAAVAAVARPCSWDEPHNAATDGLGARAAQHGFQIRAKRWMIEERQVGMVWKRWWYSTRSKALKERLRKPMWKLLSSSKVSFHTFWHYMLFLEMLFYINVIYRLLDYIADFL